MCKIIPAHKHYTMEMYRGHCVNLHVFKYGCKWQSYVPNYFMVRKDSQVPTGGNHSCSGCFGEVTVSGPYWEMNDSLVVQPVACSLCRVCYPGLTLNVVPNKFPTGI